MSNPSYGPSGDQHAAFPLNGQAARSDPRGYGAPSPVSVPSMPGRGPAVATLILGAVLMIVIAPIAFFAAMLYGIASTPGRSVQGGTTDNGSVVTVTALMAGGILDNSLRFHIGNARRHGVTAEEMAEILTHAAFYAGWPKAWAALRMAEEVYAD